MLAQPPPHHIHKLRVHTQKHALQTAPPTATSSTHCRQAPHSQHTLQAAYLCVSVRMALCATSWFTRRRISLQSMDGLGALCKAVVEAVAVGGGGEDDGVLEQGEGAMSSRGPCAALELVVRCIQLAGECRVPATISCTRRWCSRASSSSSLAGSQAGEGSAAAEEEKGRPAQQARGSACAEQSHPLCSSRALVLASSTMSYIDRCFTSCVEVKICRPHSSAREH